MHTGIMTTLKGYRTFIVNSFAITMTTIVWLLPDMVDLLLNTNLKPLLPADTIPYAMLGLGVVNLVLRKATTGPAFTKE